MDQEMRYDVKISPFLQPLMWQVERVCMSLVFGANETSVSSIFTLKTTLKC